MARGGRSNKKLKMSAPEALLTEGEAEERLAMVRHHVAKAIPTGSDWTDPLPALVEGTSVLIGNKYHAGNVKALVELGVTAVLNCASGGRHW